LLSNSFGFRSIWLKIAENANESAEATAGIGPAIGVLQTPALTTWLRRLGARSGQSQLAEAGDDGDDGRAATPSPKTRSGARPVRRQSPHRVYGNPASGVSNSHTAAPCCPSATRTPAR